MRKQAVIAGQIHTGPRGQRRRKAIKSSGSIATCLMPSRHGVLCKHSAKKLSRLWLSTVFLHQRANEFALLFPMSKVSPGRHMEVGSDPDPRRSRPVLVDSAG